MSGGHTFLWTPDFIRNVLLIVRDEAHCVSEIKLLSGADIEYSNIYLRIESK